MYILGLSAFSHDSAAALLHDGTIVAAAQEERFTRKLHEAGFPLNAARYCLDRAGIAAEELDFIGFYEKPMVKFERFLETHLAFAPAGFDTFRSSLPLWLGKLVRLPREINKELGLDLGRRQVFPFHHESHAASAFFPSPFEEAAIMTMDGMGEWSTATLGRGRGNRIELTHEIRFPHSLGLLYSAFTSYVGFEPNGGEPRLMELAPHGVPSYRDHITQHLLDLKEDGSFWMDMSYFDFPHRVQMTSPRFHQLFGRPPRRADEPLEQFHKDLAASVQAVTEEVVLRTARHVRALSGSRNLCMAGDLAHNRAANARLLREGLFESIWVQPAAGDAGGALGVALLIWYQLLENPRMAVRPDGQQGSLLGPSYDTGEIQSFLDRTGAIYDRMQEDRLLDRVSDLLASGKRVGWFQGRLEYGPSSLRGRCILTCAGRDMPPGASVGADGVEDGARAQAVDVAGDTRLSALARRLAEKTRSEAILGRSFRRGWEPIVNSPEEAYSTFMSSGIDALVLEDLLLLADAQPANMQARRGGVGMDIDPLLSEVLRCPACGAQLDHRMQGASCSACSKSFGCEEGIWRLFWPHEPFEGDVTEAVKAFYEKTPFPHYEPDETIESLIHKARKGIYARLLGEQIPYNSKVLEVGCGTGQLTNFLGVACRSVIGTDLCLNSLRLAEDFRRRSGLARVRFLQMNLFRPTLASETFDVVLCNGVLHHTSDPRRGFRSIATLVKPGGYVVIGLYNTYGRLLLDARRQLFRMTGNRFKRLDPYLRTTRLGRDKQQAWFADQYLHPHESKHDFKEVLEWFDGEGFEFVNAVPKYHWTRFTDREPLFARDHPGSGLERFIVQASMVVTGSKEGGFFVVIGRKGGA